MMTEEKFPVPEIKPFAANRISVLLEQRAAGPGVLKRRAELKQRLATELGLTLTKVTRMLNQTDQPDAPQLAVIAQVLEVSLDDLIQLEEGPRAQ